MTVPVMAAGPWHEKWTALASEQLWNYLLRFPGEVLHAQHEYARIGAPTLQETQDTY